MYDILLSVLKIVIVTKIANDIYAFIFFDFLSFFVRIGMFSVSAGAYLAIIKINSF